MSSLIQKLALGLVAIVAFIVGIVGITASRPSIPFVSQSSGQKSAPAANKVNLILSAPKTSYSLKESIPLEIVLEGNNLALAAVQLRLVYGPNLSPIEPKTQTPLSGFLYTSNTNVKISNELQLVAIMKDPQQPLRLQGSQIFARITFKPTKVGTAEITVGSETFAFSPGSEINILNKVSNLKLNILP